MKIIVFDTVLLTEAELTGCDITSNTYSLKMGTEYIDVDCDRVLFQEKIPDNMELEPIGVYDLEYKKTIYFRYNNRLYRVYIRDVGWSYYGERKRNETRETYRSFIGFIRWLRYEHMDSLFKLVEKTQNKTNNQTRLEI